MKTAIWFLAIALLLLLGYLSYSGLFARVQFEEREFGGEWLVYETHKGDYSKVAPVMDEVYQRLKEQDIETEAGFGIYYDKPGEVPAEELRSEVGCVIPERYAGQLEELQDSFKVKQYPLQACIVAEMPYRNKLSILLGVFKVYPKLQKAVAEKGYPENPVMERYDQGSKRIYYVMPIDS